MSGEIEKLPEPIVIKLQYPLDRGEKLGQLTELVFERQAIANDFKGLSTSLTIDEQVTLASRLTEVPRAILGRLRAPDLFKTLETISSFLQPSPADGKTL